MAQFKLFYGAVREELTKVTTAFITWGIGVLVMVVYCLFLVWTQSNFGLYVTIIGALFYLALVFFVIDLWWNYSQSKNIKRIKEIS